MQRSSQKRSIIVVFGEMASGKSTVAKELAYRYLNLPEDGFFEGDHVLNLPELHDLKSKVIKNDALTPDDVNRLIDALISEIKSKLTNQTTLVVSQALYFDHDRKKIKAALQDYDVKFIWVKSPYFSHMSHLFSREYASYLQDKPWTLNNYARAIMNGFKSIRTYRYYHQYFEKPAGHFSTYSSDLNRKNHKKSNEPLTADVINNDGQIADLISAFRQVNLQTDMHPSESTMIALDQLAITTITPAATVNINTKHAIDTASTDHQEDDIEVTNRLTLR